MFVLAHLSDPHLAPMPRPRLAELAGKRALGLLNWRRKRGAIHRAEVLAALVRDLQAQANDHLAITGDLVNIALAAEFAAARTWLERLGAPQDVTLVPGNHDAYVRAWRKHSQAAWGAYMRGDGGESFPFVRRRGPVALIGLSSALPTGPFTATGRLGEEQLARLATALAACGRDGLFRVVLIHHPLVSSPARYFKRLIDANKLAATLRAHGAELVLHGHDHRRALRWLDGGGRRIPCVGAPSASAAHDGAGEPAGYWRYEIDGAAGAWRCAAILRGFRRGEGALSELARVRLIS